MGKLIDYLKATSHLPLYATLKRGTLIDQGSSALGALAITGAPLWKDTDRGDGLWTPNAGANYVSPGNPVALQLNTGTIFAVGCRTESATAAYQAILNKQNAYTFGFNPAAEPRAFGVYDWNSGLWRASTFVEGPTGLLHLFAMSYQSGVVNGTTLYVDGVPCGITTLTVVNQLSDFRIGAGGGGQGFGGTVLLAGVCDLVLTGAQHAQLWDEFLQEGWVKNLARKNFVYQYPAKRASEYAAAGIVLDTDFKRINATTVRDLVGSYPGTIVGIPVPGQNDEGMLFSSACSLNQGDVTAFNSVAAFTYETVIDTGPGNIPALSYIFGKGPADLIVLSNVAASAAVQPLTITWVVGGVTFTATTTSTQWRTGTQQHVAIVFDGAGVGNAGRLKLYVDGEEVALTFAGAGLPVPATTPNLAGGSLIYGNPGVAVQIAAKQERMFNRALTAAQVRTEYLQWAQRLILRETLEDVPVTLTASVAAGGQIGPWTLYGDTWACVESATGRRSMKHIGAGHGAASRPSSQAFGTWHFFMRPGTVSVNEQYVLFIASQPGTYAATGQNGYMIYLSAGQPWLFRLTGAVATSLGSGPVGSIVADTQYEVIINRRPSDCRMTIWMCGGAWGTTWTQVIQATEASHVTSQYISLGSVLRSDSFPMFDPFDATV